MSLTSFWDARRKHRSARDWSFFFCDSLRRRKHKKKNRLRMKFNFLFQVFFLLLILSRLRYFFARWCSRESIGGQNCVVFWCFFCVKVCARLLIHPVRSATFWLVCMFFAFQTFFSFTHAATNVKNYKMKLKRIFSAFKRNIKRKRKQQSKWEKRSEIFDGFWCLF